MRVANDLALTHETAAALVFSVLGTVETILDPNRDPEFILTSNHRRPRLVGDKSYHRFGTAWDFDLLWGLTGTAASKDELDAAATLVRDRLRMHFDVVVHQGIGDWHIHVEWDPKF